MRLRKGSSTPVDKSGQVVPTVRAGAATAEPWRGTAAGTAAGTVAGTGIAA